MITSSDFQCDNPLTCPSRTRPPPPPAPHSVPTARQSPLVPALAGLPFRIVSVGLEGESVLVPASAGDAGAAGLGDDATPRRRDAISMSTLPFGASSLPILAPSCRQELRDRYWTKCIAKSCVACVFFFSIESALCWARFRLVAMLAVSDVHGCCRRVAPCSHSDGTPPNYRADMVSFSRTWRRVAIALGHRQSLRVPTGVRDPWPYLAQHQNIDERLDDRAATVAVHQAGRIP